MNNREMFAGCYQTLAIRQARKNNESASAVQTIVIGGSHRAGAEDVGFNAEPTGISRMGITVDAADEKKASVRPRPFVNDRNRRLLQRGVDRVELGVQVAAEAVDDSDNRKRNAGRDEAVFDRGGAGLVFHETRNQILHRILHVNTWLVELTVVSRRSQHRDHSLTLRSDNCGAVNSIVQT
jgi:hypothetical protein